MAPLPRTNTLCIQSNFGILGNLDHVCESIEEELGVIRSWRLLWMPLHRKNRFGFVFNAFDSFCVGVYEPGFQRCFAETFCVDGVAMILGCDVAAIGFQVQCGLILGAMAVF